MGTNTAVVVILNLVRCAAKFSVNVRTVSLIKFASRSLHTKVHPENVHPVR